MRRHPPARRRAGHGALTQRPSEDPQRALDATGPRREGSWRELIQTKRRGANSGDPTVRLCALWVDLGIVFAAAIVAGLAAGLAAAAWLQADRTRVLVAGFATAILAGLITGELASAGVRSWWSERPLAASTTTGLLLLVLAVLVVEAIVKAILLRAERQTWRSTGAAAAANLMSRVSTAMSEFQRTTLWSATVAVDAFEDASPEIDSEAEQLGATLTRAVLDVTGMLTANAELGALYEHAVIAASAARDLPEAIRNWMRSHADKLTLPTLESESARLSWWSDVMQTWDLIVDQMTAFQTMAERDLELVSETSYAWQESGPTGYEKARHAYLAEHR
jgi:hypothetical protein